MFQERQSMEEPLVFSETWFMTIIQALIIYATNFFNEYHLLICFTTSRAFDSFLGTKVSKNRLLNFFLLSISIHVNSAHL